uniref:Uncharacterized protein n=1 Tax=Anopheles atroparvus TaxID=41427 RepID=A0A182J5X6_ANOAO
MNKFVFVVLCALLVGGALGDAALGNYYKDVVREQHKVINEMNQNFTELEKASEKLIDLGFYVGRHTLPPKTVKITKTVAVKVPVPFPVKVPEPVPVPVPVSKPVPVPVPTLVAVPVEGTAQTATGQTLVVTVPATSASTPTVATVPSADAAPASSLVHASTVQVQDWKNTSSASTTNSTDITSRRRRTSIIAKSLRKRDRMRARNSTTHQAPEQQQHQDSTMVVLKFKPLRIRLQSTDLSRMRSNRRPSRMAASGPATNSTRPRSPVPRIRRIPLRHSTPEANLRRLRRRPSAKTTASPESSSISVEEEEQEKDQELLYSSDPREEQRLDLALTTEEDHERESLELEQDSEQQSEEEEEEETEESEEEKERVAAVRSRTSSSAKLRKAKRPTKKATYRVSKTKPKRSKPSQQSRPDGKKKRKKASASSSSKERERPREKKSTSLRHARSKLFENRTRGMRSPILRATKLTTPIRKTSRSSTIITTTTTTTTTEAPAVYEEEVPARVPRVLAAASSPKASIIRHLNPFQSPPPVGPVAVPEEHRPRHTVTRYRGDAPPTRRYPPRATIIRIHIIRTHRGKHIKIFVIKPTPPWNDFLSTEPPKTIPTLLGEASSPIEQRLKPESSEGGSVTHHHHQQATGYHTFTEHHPIAPSQHEQYGTKHTGSYGVTAKPTLFGVPSDAHLFPNYTPSGASGRHHHAPANGGNHHHDHHDHHAGSGHSLHQHNDAPSGKFHYHFHNVHVIGGDASATDDHHQSAASEHQYAVHGGSGSDQHDGGHVTSYDPPASGNTYHFHDDTDDLLAGATDTQEQLHQPPFGESSSYRSAGFEAGTGHQ